MKKLYTRFAAVLLGIILLSAGTSKAQDDQTTAVSSINLAVVMPPAIDGLTDANLSLMNHKIVAILTNGGLSSDDQDKTFIVTPAFHVISSAPTQGGLRALFITECSFNLFIKQNSTKTILATYTKSIQGTGFTKEESISQAVSQISADHNGLDNFIKNGKTKVGAYIQQNCQQFMGNAEREIAKQNYEGANAILLSIPAEAGTCYTDAQKKLGDIYSKQYGSLDKAEAKLNQDVIINPANAVGIKQLAVVKQLIEARNDQDKTPPEITLLSPAATRGQTVDADVTKTAQIYVSGSAKDPSKIGSVTVNGKPVTDITDDGFFHTNIPQSETDIVINATDKKGNMASVTYHIGAKTPVKGSEEIMPLNNNEKFHAIFIANSEYSGGGWAPLPTTVPEARSLIKMLEAQYNFDPANVDTIFNKSGKEILSTVRTKLSALTANDNVIIFYAGHGKFNEAANMAFWVPVNTSEEEDYISNTMISAFLATCPAHHILIMADACFSGAMRGGVEAPPDYKFKRNSRQLLASGGIEPVPGVSVYVKTLLKYLGENTDPYMTAKDLTARIYPDIKNQGRTDCTIQTLQVSGSEGGEFYFKKN